MLLRLAVYQDGIHNATLKVELKCAKINKIQSIQKGEPNEAKTTIS